MLKIKNKDLFRSHHIKGDKDYFIDKYKDDNYEGYISLIVWKNLERKIIVPYHDKNLLIADEGYKWVQISLRNEHVWITSMYDESDNLIEIYMDVSIENSLEDINNLHFYDLFCDVIISKDMEVELLDRSELKGALDEGLITQELYDLGKDISKKLYNYTVNNKEEIVNFCYQKLQELENKYLR